MPWLLDSSNAKPLWTNSALALVMSHKHLNLQIIDRTDTPINQLDIKKYHIPSFIETTEMF